MSDATITSAGMRVIKLLVGRPPQTVGDLIDETGVTRTAVTEQLNDLVNSGFVERTIERLAGRGRPRHRFSATHAALLLLFANNQQLVVPSIWKAIEKIGGESLTRKVLQSVSQDMTNYYMAKITATDPQTRLEQLAVILEEEGGLVAVLANEGHITIKKRTCAFASMCDEKRRVCDIDLEMMSAIAGCPVRQTACRLKGDPCCEFAVDTRSKNGSAAAHHTR